MLLKKVDYKSKVAISLFGILILILVIFFYPTESHENNKYTPGEIRFRSLEETGGVVTNIWMRGTSKLDQLKENNMRYLMVDIGPTNRNGKISTERKEIEEFLAFVDSYEKENNYDFMVLPYSEINTNVYDINSFVFQTNFINDYVSLVELGFGGVLIDIEYVPENREESYLKILDSLAEKIPEDSLISAYVIGINEEPNSWEWSPEFFEAVANRTNFVALSSYDTEIQDSEEYKLHLEEELEYILGKEWNTYFMYMVPTHKQWPETLTNALEIFDSKTKEQENQFIGIGVFAEWTTDNSEWSFLKNYQNKG